MNPSPRKMRKGTDLTILSQIVQRMKKSKKTFSSVAPKAGRIINKMKPLYAFLDKFVRTTFKYKAPVFNIALGIYQVLEGVKEMNPMFNHQIIATTRSLSKEIDDMIEIYHNMLGVGFGESIEKLENLHTVYSIDVQVENGNWDYFSGVYFILSDGTKNCSTRGSGVTSLSKGWVTFNISNSNTLNGCLFFEFHNSNLSVSVVHHQNSHLSDSVTIDTIQVSVDGNYLPSFEVDTPITVGNGVDRSGFLRFKPMKMKLKAINTHTSEILKSGTDADCYIQLDLGSGVLPEWIQLDNDNFNDRERGQTDIYKGSTLKKGNQMLRDYAEFYPESAEIKITFNMKSRWDWSLNHLWNKATGDWNTDLLKLYFTGKNGKVVVIRCLAGEKWIPLNKDHTFDCKRMEENYPATSIEMFEAHTCNYRYASSSSRMMKLKLCRKPGQFQTFNESSKKVDCCCTNYFPLDSTLNEWKRYDAISHSDTLDGGAVLGQCEGFDLLGTEIYVGKTKFKKVMILGI